MPTHPLRTPAARLVAVAAIATLAIWSNSATARSVDAAAAGAAGTTRANELTIEAADYAFTMPDTVAAGLTRIRLVNRGPELHHTQIIRLEQGRTLGDLFAAMQAHGAQHGVLPAWAREVGGPNTPVPGGESAAVVDLAPGSYAVLCVIPSPDGKPHVMKGMAKALTVVAGRPATQVDVPAVTATMTLSDYDFALSAPLTAGSHVLRVVNRATQAHEVVIARLEPGRTAHDLLAWMEKMDGPPPGAPLGGTVGLAKDAENLVLLDLEPGEYALICFIPDAGDGRPHFMHGMVKQITVK